MSVQVYVTATDPNTASSLEIDEREILPTLGPQEKAVAVQLQELFASVTDSIASSLEVESQLSLEITGSITLRVEGGVKYLFFNVGASAEAAGTMKVALSTTLRPKSN